MPPKSPLTYRVNLDLGDEEWGLLLAQLSIMEDTALEGLELEPEPIHVAVINDELKLVRRIRSLISKDLGAVNAAAWEEQAQLRYKSILPGILGTGAGPVSDDDNAFQ